jgi:hypothetical protein
MAFAFMMFLTGERRAWPLASRSDARSECDAEPMRGARRLRRKRHHVFGLTEIMRRYL